MNKEPKKRVSSSLPLAMIAQIENINQTSYLGCVKFQNVMLKMIDLGFFAIDCFGGFENAWAMMRHAAKEREQTPAIIPPHGMILEFPCGKRLSGSQAKPTA